MRTTDFATELSRFLGLHLPSERGSSPHTVASYRDTFVLLLRYARHELGIAAEDIVLEDYTRDLVIDFLAWLEGPRGCSASTRNVRLAALKSFARFLQYEQPQLMSQMQSVLSIPAKKTAKPPVTFAKADGIRLILGQADHQTPSGRRDLAMLSLMYDTGARVSEVCDLTPKSIRLDFPPTATLVGKGRKARTVPLSDEVVGIMDTYMSERGLDKPEANCRPLFSNRSGAKLTPSGVAYVLDKYVKMARSVDPVAVPEGFSCHSMRHSRAMALLAGGVNLVYIRDLLGHSSVQTTEVYARVDGKLKREAIERASEKLGNGLEPIWLENGDLLRWLESLGRRQLK